VALTGVAYDNTNNRFKRLATGAGDYRAGLQAVTSGVSTISVTFSSAIASTSYSVVCTWQNLTDAHPQFQDIVVTAFSTTGFTATWNAPTDSANYSVSWTVTAFS
jgi:hypothetical protein